MSTDLQQILDFSRQTGDRVIVVSEYNNQTPLVILTLNEYKKIYNNNQTVKDLSEQELLDKINRDIAIWRSFQDDNEKDRLGNYTTQDLSSSADRWEDFADSKEDFIQERDTRDDWDWDRQKFDDKFNDFDTEDFGDIDDTGDEFANQDTLDFNVSDQLADKESAQLEEQEYVSAEPMGSQYSSYKREQLPVITEADEFQVEPDIPARI